MRPVVYKFPLGNIDGNRIRHPSMVVRTYGNPDVVPGKLGNAIELDGRAQYVDFGDHANTCFGNLDNCIHGATIALWMKPEKFQRDAYYFSTGGNGITMWYKNKRLYVSAMTSTNTWELSTDAVDPKMWNHLEVSWSEQNGLRLFSDNQLVASSDQRKPRSSASGSDSGRVYLGRGNIDMSSAKYGAGQFDEMEYWYSDRDYLSAFGYIHRGELGITHSKSIHAPTKTNLTLMYGGPISQSERNAIVSLYFNMSIRNRMTMVRTISYYVFELLKKYTLSLTKIPAHILI